MNADADRNLLFGLLALQNGLVDQDQLLAAFRAWSRDPARSIPDLLADRGLDDEQRALIDGLVAQHIKRHGGSAERSLAALDLDRIRHDLGRIDPSVVEATFARIPTRPGADTASTGVDEADRTASLSVGSATSEGQRFRVLRPHAQGGLGAVFVALDTELHREVALKQILDSHADDLISRARFLLEAEITGGLEHPGIVPVYGLGTYDGGRPYYAMRFIRGESLKEAIDQFHAVGSHPKDSGRRSLELRRLLRCFTDVCHAIEYAHGRGVLHRDIKPRNVIVGRHGETLVVDWGLAKATGKADPASGERTLVPSSASGSAETLPGSAMGTPAYMSPEQAEGDLERLGPPSDVYSLGATLYYLLTGATPFPGEDVADVLRRVRRGEFHPPRQLDPGIDPALEAVCKKAMAQQPADRYATPRALVDDVERWMADEPVSAWREPIGRRLRRWARRNRTAVATGAVAVLALLFGTAAVLAVQTQANGRLKLANTELAAAKDRETARFNLAMEAIKLFHGQVGDDLVLKEDRFKPLRDKLLRGATGFYGQLEGLLKDQTDRASRAAMGRAYAELGKLTATIGDNVEALAVDRKALAVRRALASEPGADAETMADVARTLHAIGADLQATGKTDEAIAAYEEARGSLNDLTRIGTIPDGGRVLLAMVETDLAELLYDTGKTADAMAGIDRSIAVLARLVEAHPEVAEYRSELASTQLSMGYLRTRDGKPEKALESHRRARAILQKLADDFPAVINYRFELGRSDINIGYTLEALKRPDEALVAYSLALATFQKLGVDNPAVTRFRAAVPDIHFQMGRALSRIPRPAEALESFGHARAGFQKLADDNPAYTEIRYMLGICHENIGELMRSMGRPAEAMESYRRALVILQKVVDESPAVSNYRDDLAVNHLYLGELFMSMASPAEAEPEFRAAVAGYGKLFEEIPDSTVYRTYLARGLHDLGGLLRVTGRRDEAMASYRRALVLRDRLASAHPSDAEHQSQLGETLNDAALCEMRPGGWKEALSLLERAVEQQRKALTSAPANPTYRRLLTDHLTNLVTVHQALAQPAETLRAERELAELLDRGFPDDPFAPRD